MGASHSEIWAGDGLPADDDDALNLIGPFFDFEVEGLIEACKREAWISEKLAKHEGYEGNIEIARFFWRRTERLRELLKLQQAEDNETE